MILDFWRKWMHHGRGLGGELYSKPSESGIRERRKLLVALGEGVPCRFDIMIPWNIVRRIPRGRRDGT